MGKTQWAKVFDRQGAGPKGLLARNFRTFKAAVAGVVVSLALRHESVVGTPVRNCVAVPAGNKPPPNVPWSSAQKSGLSATGM